jgi:hypothetical protein
MAGFGVDVLDPAVSTRRVAVLLDRLPPAARRGGQQWSTEAELLAVVADHLAALTWVTMRAHGAKNVPKPRPMPRPPQPGGAAPPAAQPTPGPSQPGAAKASSWADAAAMLGGMPGVKVVTSGG